jgi:hypothetical protein
MLALITLCPKTDIRTNIIKRVRLQTPKLGNGVVVIVNCMTIFIYENH